MSAPTPWATVRLRPVRDRQSRWTRELLADRADALEAIAGLLMDCDGVGGVEVRDPTTLIPAEWPELWVYCEPDAIERVQARAAAAGEHLSLTLAAQCETHEDDTWRDGWRAFYGKQRFGDGRLLVRPSWLPRAPDDPEREIVLDPGRAFGTGLHESTRLALEAVVSLLHEDAPAPARVLDLGCGSGILALGAARLASGASVDAIDFDAQAVETTRENAELNALPSVVARVGTIAVAEGPYDLVVANIRPEVLIPDAAQIVSVCTGTLILSGIVDDEADRVQAAYAPLAPWTSIERRHEGGWTALIFERASA